MPKTGSVRDGAKAPAPTERRRPQGRDNPAESSLVDEQVPLQLSGAALPVSDFGRSAFQHHAELLGSSSLSRPVHSRQRALIVQRLHRDYGNRYVQRLVDHISRRRPEEAQTKLSVGPSGDKYEQEADRLARQVMGTIASGQDRIDHDTLQGHEELVSLKPVDLSPQIGLEGGDVDATVEESIQKARGRGQGLSENVRVPMEDAFKADFADVRIHTGPEVDTFSRSMSARAFTTGQDIFFGEGEPGSSEGREVLAHELTHVVQQSGIDAQADKPASSSDGRIQRDGNGDADPGGAQEGGTPEAEADVEAEVQEVLEDVPESSWLSLGAFTSAVQALVQPVAAGVALVQDKATQLYERWEPGAWLVAALAEKGITVPREELYLSKVLTSYVFKYGTQRPIELTTVEVALGNGRSAVLENVHVEGLQLVYDSQKWLFDTGRWVPMNVTVGVLSIGRVRLLGGAAEGAEGPAQLLLEARVTLTGIELGNLDALKTVPGAVTRALENLTTPEGAQAGQGQPTALARFTEALNNNIQGAGSFSVASFNVADFKTTLDAGAGGMGAEGGITVRDIRGEVGGEASLSVGEIDLALESLRGYGIDASDVTLVATGNGLDFTGRPIELATVEIALENGRTAVLKELHIEGLQLEYESQEWNAKIGTLSIGHVWLLGAGAEGVEGPAQLLLEARVALTGIELENLEVLKTVPGAVTGALENLMTPQGAQAGEGQPSALARFTEALNNNVQGTGSFSVASFTVTDFTTTLDAGAGEVGLEGGITVTDVSGEVGEEGSLSVGEIDLVLENLRGYGIDASDVTLVATGNGLDFTVPIARLARKQIISEGKVITLENGTLVNLRGGLSSEGGFAMWIDTIGFAPIRIELAGEGDEGPTQILDADVELHGITLIGKVDTDIAQLVGDALMTRVEQEAPGEGDLSQRIREKLQAIFENELPQGLKADANLQVDRVVANIGQAAATERLTARGVTAELRGVEMELGVNVPEGESSASLSFDQAALQGLLDEPGGNAAITIRQAQIQTDGDGNGHVTVELTLDMPELAKATDVPGALSGLRELTIGLEVAGHRIMIETLKMNPKGSFKAKRVIGLLKIRIEDEEGEPRLRVSALGRRKLDEPVPPGLGIPRRAEEGGGKGAIDLRGYLEQQLQGKLREKVASMQAPAPEQPEG